MSIVSDIEIRLRADIARLQADMTQARTAVSGAMSGISKAVDSAMSHIKQLAGAIAVGAFVGFIKDAIDAVDALTDLSTRTGITVEDLAGLAYGAKLSGTELEAAATTINKLSVSMGKEGDRFAKLGVTAAEPIEAFKQIADIFKSIQDPQARAAFGAEALGKAWQESAVLLSEGSAGITELMARGHELSGVTTQNSADAAKFNDTLDEITATAGGLKNRLAVELLPTLNDLASQFLAVSTQGDGTKKVVDNISSAVKVAISVGTILYGVFDSVATVIALVILQLKTFTEGLIDTFREMVQVNRNWGKVGKAISDTFTGVASNLGWAGKEVADTWSSVGTTVSTTWTGAAKDVKDAADVMEGVEFPDPFGIDAKEAADAAARAEAFVKYGEAQAAAKKLAGEAAAAAKKEQEAYRALITTLAERIAAGKAEVAAGRELTEAEKATIKLDSELASGKLKLSAAHVDHVRALMAEAAALDRQAVSAKVVREAVQALTDQQNQAYATLAAETIANQQAVLNYGLSKQAIEANTIALLQDQLARRGELDMSEAYAAQLEREIALRKENAGAISRLSDLQDAKKAADELAEFLDPAKAQSFGDALADAFGTAGSALAKLGNQFQAYASKQAVFEKQRGSAATKYLNGLSTEEEYQRDLGAIQKQRAASQLGDYGNMAGAAAGFFGEQSKGYKTLMAVSQVFHAAELAATLAELVPKGIAAVLNQAGGDPYTAFGRMAAMAAVVAGLGVAISGGSSKGANVAAERQVANGTGTVLGDSGAKSESMSRALALVADNTYRGLSISSDMLAALRSINSNLSGLGSLIVRTSGISGDVAGVAQGAAANLAAKTINALPFTAIADKLTGGVLTKISNSVVNSIFGGKVTTLDTGLTGSKTALGAAVAGGIQASQYTDTKKDGGLFSSDKYRTALSPLGAEINDQFTLIIRGMADGVKTAAEALGMGGDAFTQHLNTFVVDLGKISLKGLTGAEIQSALEAAFSKLGDDMAKFAVGDLTQFQQIGEGAYETLVRIANEYATVDAVLASFGKTFGAVGLASVGAREELIKLAGGLDEFTSQGSFFLDNFFTDMEKAATLRTAVDARISPLNGGVAVTTIEQYKALALAQDLTTATGREAYSTLMSTAAAFKELVDYGDAAGKTIEDIASERKNLQEQIDALTLNSMQLRAKERATISAGNLALYDQLQALNDLAAARTAETDKLTAVATGARSFAASLTTVLDSLTQGSLSTLTPLQKLADAQGKYQQTLAAAQAGDESARGALAAAAQAYLTADQVVNASSSRYAADAARVQAELAALASAAVGQATDAEKQLAVLTSQADGILKVNESVNLATTSIVTAIDNLRATGYDVPTSTMSTGRSTSTASTGGPDTVALANALASVQKELAAMRAEAAQHAGYIADTVATSSAANADTITQGTKSAAMDQVYAEQLTPKVT